MQLREFTERHSRPDGDWAKEIGITRVYFCDIRNGNAIPRPNIMRRIFDVTDGLVTPNDMVLTDAQKATLPDEMCVDP